MSDDELKRAAAQGLEELKDRLPRQADGVTVQIFERVNKIVDEELAPLLAVMGASSDEIRYVLLRMVLVSTFKYGLESAWGPGDDQQQMSMDFVRATFGRMGGALATVVGRPCRLAVVWEDEDTGQERSRLILPGQ